MRTLIILFLSLVFLLPSANAQAKIIRVPADSSCIQCAINGAVDGDTVLVARGHYYERINFLGKTILVASNFVLDNDTTTIDSTIIDGDSLVGDTGSVVVFVSDEDSNSAIKGFTIQNGIGTSTSFGNRWGGGIYISYSSPTISNNAITGNSAGRGGGISCFQSSPAITNNVITGNSAYSDGGGVFCMAFSSPILANNALMGNVANYGGGIACEGYSSPVVRNNIISANSGYLYGGGIYCMYRSEPIISNNAINGNSTNFWGGGIFFYYYSSPTLRNNIVSNNRGGKGIVCAENSYPAIHHNDVWNNGGGNFHQCPAGIGDTTWGINFNGAPCDSFYNIIRDPLFIDTIAFELLCNSPCIDAGDPSSEVPIDSGGCRIDMGLHEYAHILGDANSDGIITPKKSKIGGINVGDVAYIINYLFVNGPSPCPYHTGDPNCDGWANIADAVCLINYLFIGGPLPCGF